MSNIISKYLFGEYDTEESESLSSESLSNTLEIIMVQSPQQIAKLPSIRTNRDSPSNQLTPKIVHIQSKSD